jgi:hypothetical protein
MWENFGFPGGFEARRHRGTTRWTGTIMSAWARTKCRNDSEKIARLSTVFWKCDRLGECVAAFVHYVATGLATKGNHSRARKKVVTRIPAPLFRANFGAQCHPSVPCSGFQTRSRGCRELYIGYRAPMCYDEPQVGTISSKIRSSFWPKNQPVEPSGEAVLAILLPHAETT